MIKTLALMALGIVVFSSTTSIVYGGRPYYGYSGVGCFLPFKSSEDCDESYFGGYGFVYAIATISLVFSGMFALAVWLLNKEKSDYRKEIVAEQKPTN